MRHQICVAPNIFVYIPQGFNEDTYWIYDDDIVLLYPVPSGEAVCSITM